LVSIPDDRESFNKECTQQQPPHGGRRMVAAAWWPPHGELDENKFITDCKD